MHDYEAKCLHLVYPGLVFFAEFGNGWPLILAPEQLTLIRIVNGAVKVDCFVVVSLPLGNIFLQPLVSYQRDVGRSSNSVQNGGRTSGIVLVIQRDYLLFLLGEIEKLVCEAGKL